MSRRRRRTDNQVLIICLGGLVAAGALALTAIGVLMTLDVRALAQIGRP